MKYYKTVTPRTSINIHTLYSSLHELNLFTPQITAVITDYLTSCHTNNLFISLSSYDIHNILTKPNGTTSLTIDLCATDTQGNDYDIQLHIKRHPHNNPSYHFTYNNIPLSTYINDLNNNRVEYNKVVADLLNIK